ncbi:hypothetical protein D3C71_1431460 [compost metagenome]
MLTLEMGEADAKSRVTVSPATALVGSALLDDMETELIRFTSGSLVPSILNSPMLNTPQDPSA